jgi:hypothetical protein
VAEAEEEEEGQVEASLEELIAKKADRPTITDDEDEDESLLTTGQAPEPAGRPPANPVPGLRLGMAPEGGRGGGGPAR